MAIPVHSAVRSGGRLRQLATTLRGKGLFDSESESFEELVAPNKETDEESLEWKEDRREFNFS